MATAGFILLVAGFVAAIMAALGLLVGHFTKKNAFILIGQVGIYASALSLLACCSILVYCFMTGDVSIEYVLEQRSLSTDQFAWLYKLSGLWAGRSGSLLFWTFLISLFAAIVALRSLKSKKKARTLDNLAMAVVAIVVAIFAGVLLFSDGNMPFTASPAAYFNEDGSLTTEANMYFMNPLLEHWAMAIHPPMLFMGYAGLTVPFAYAIATLITNDATKLWVNRATRFVLASWLFLGFGIGLGSVWAYVVLGWGGYWGWDPVENASLLSWLVCTALVHTFSVYRQRGAFKRWGVMCACLAFTFVIVATFITRSGIVESVHAFAGDPVSLSLFGGLIIASLMVPIVGIIIRWKSFGPDKEGGDDVENIFSKEAAYYFNNVIMLIFTLLLTYMTLSSALPSWLPFGGDSLGKTSYEAIARPLGIFYLAVLSICPLLAWGKTKFKSFFKQARIPAICALLVFLGLLFWWKTQLLPIYDDMMAKGNANSQTLLEAGPAWYYNGLAVVALLVASLLFFNVCYLFVRSWKSSTKRASAIGGSFAHIAMAVILVGLVGSNMYVFEESGYMHTEEQDIGEERTQITSADPFEVREYRLEYVSDSVENNIDPSNQVDYITTFDVFKNDQYIGQVSPSVKLNTVTQQQKLNAAVVSFPEEDLFVVYRGVNTDGDFSLDVRINPFISFVWVGFGMLMLGTLAALVGRRGKA